MFGESSHSSAYVENDCSQRIAVEDTNGGFVSSKILFSDQKLKELSDLFELKLLNIDSVPESIDWGLSYSR